MDELEFKNILKHYRKKKKLNQTDIAKMLNITQPAYSQYENGIREPDIKTLLKLSKIFNVPVDVLIGNTTDFYNNG